MTLTDSCCPQREGSSQHTRGRRVSGSASSSVGQLRLARPTKTTVVTTTTRTYITLPPLVITPPANLKERDPRQYPLASAHPPELIERFRFKYDGHDALFQKVEHEVGVRETLLEHDGLNKELDASNGELRTEATYISEPDFATPTHAGSEVLPKSAYWVGPSAAPPAASYEWSPPSLAVAAKMAGRQRARRHNRKPRGPRGSQDRESSPTSENTVDPVLVTPDTPAEVPPSATGPAETFPLDDSFPKMNENGEGVGSVWEREKSNAASMLPPGNVRRPRIIRPFAETGIDEQPFLDEPKETPYIASPNSKEPSVRPRRLPPLDTVSAQDVCLPSPSLSPITAAANVAQHHSTMSTGGLRRGDGEFAHLSSLDVARRDAQGDHHISSDLTQLPNETALSGEASSAPTLMTIPSMIDSFDALPDPMKTFIMYEMLRRCPRPTLHFVADTVNTALKCDFLDLLPLELSLNITRYLDLKSLCNAAQVSKKWRTIIDTDEAAWKDLLESDGYSLPPGELGRAIREGWGWQYPHSSESWERDLRPSSSATKFEFDTEYAASSSLASLTGSDHSSLRSSSGRLKRKATTKQSSSKKRKKGDISFRSNVAPFQKPTLHDEGPNALAEVAVAAVPSPNIGLESLRCMHLFKSLYQRHHLIRKSWMEEDSKPKHIAFRAHQRHVVTCLQFDTDKILTGSDDTNINVYDTKSGALRNRLEGHEGGVWALQYEGNTLVSGSTDRSVRVWDIERGRCTAVFNGHTSTVRCLVILKPTQVGETANGQPIMMPKEPLIITGSRDSTLRVWKLPSQNGSKTALQTGPPVYNDNDNPYFIRVLSGHTHSVRAIAAHGDTLVSGSYDTTVRVWKISTGETIHQLHGHAQKVYSVVLDHARNRCISGSMDTSVKVWCLETGTCLFNLEGHASLVGLLDLSYDRLVSAAADSTLRIWDPDTGECKSTLRAHTGAITCFQHDAQKVISGSDRTLKMWNVKTGKFVKDLLTDLSGVWQVKFNERRCVAAVQRDNMTYIEVLDFGASRDGVPPDQLGRRIVVNSRGQEVEDNEDAVEADSV